MAERWGVIGLGVVASAQLCGCGGKTDEANGARVVQPSTCAGAITSQPTVLRSDLPSGRIVVAGDVLILVADDGGISRIDRCSGVSSHLASDVDIASFTVTNEHVWFASSGVERGLFVVPMSGGAVEQIVPDIAPSTLRAHHSMVYLTASVAGDIRVASIDIGQSESTPIATLPSRPGQYRSFGAVSEAGLYFSNWCDDYGCAPTLSRLPFGAAELMLVEGADGSSGGYGGYAVAVAGDHLYVKANVQIARLPLTGGELELVATEMTSGGLEQFKASERAVCWMAWMGSELATRCAALADASHAVRELDRFQPAGASSLDVAPDAVYWLRPSADGVLQELVAVAL